MRERHGAQAIARFERGARRQQPLRKLFAAPVRRREQRGIQLSRDHIVLDEIELASELTTGRGLHGLCGRGCAQARQHEAGNRHRMNERGKFAPFQLVRPCRNSQLLRQERKSLLPGIGLGGPDGGLVLGGTLEAVSGAGVTVERMRDAQARELGIEPVGVLREGLRSSLPKKPITGQRNRAS